MRTFTTLLLILLTLVCGQVRGEPQWYTSIMVGHGQQQNPLKQQANLLKIANVNFSYFSEHLFFDSGDIGWTLLNNNYLTLSAVGTINNTFLYYEDPSWWLIGFGSLSGRGSSETTASASPVAAPVVEAVDAPVDEPAGEPPTISAPTEPTFDPIAFLEQRTREAAIETGIEVLFELAGTDFSGQFFTDISGKHQGWSTKVEASKLIRQPFNLQSLSLVPSAHIQYNSQNKNNYYWGVPGQWHANQTWQPGAGLTALWHFNNRWGLHASLNYQHLGDLTNSPIIDKEGLLSGFIGVVYQIR